MGKTFGEFVCMSYVGHAHDVWNWVDLLKQFQDVMDSDSEYKEDFGRGS